MTLQQVLRTLGARWRLALLVFLATIAGTYATSLMLPLQYTASSTVVVDVQARDPIFAMLPVGTMTTQEDIIKSDRVAQKAVKMLRLDENETVKEQWRENTGGKGRIDVWLADLLQKKLNVIPPRRDSNVLGIEYTAVDSRFAAAAANAFAQSYVEATLELKVQPAKQYAEWFADQGKGLRAGLEKAQARLSEFQQTKGIVTKEENYDSETTRLAELMSQLTAAQALTADARTKQQSAGDNLPEVLGNAVVQSLRADVARQEVKLKEASLNLGSNHPQYQRMEAELAMLQAKLKAETRHVSGSFATSNAVATGKERELTAAIEAQRKKLLELRRDRDQLAVLQRDVEAAQTAYAAVAARHTQTSLESQAKQTNVSILSAAVEPLQPSSPNLLRYTAMAVFFGALLALGAALGAELLDRRLRSVEDVTGMLQIPVLSVIQPVPARHRVRIARRQPALSAR